jgi:choline dehydrogenase-like flavoprotein
MLIDAGGMPSGEQLQADVAVVGAGPAGITIADELAAAGLRVAILESGGLAPDESSLSLTDGFSVGYPYYPLRDMHVRAFGGNSHVWSPFGVRSRPLDPIDFEQRDAVAYSGWPFPASELDDYYARACKTMGLKPSFQAASWAPPTQVQAPLPLDTSAARAYSTVFQFADRQTFTRRYDALRNHSDVRLLLRATVLRVLAGEDGHDPDTVTGLAVRGGGADGPEIRVRARIYVLAAGGIGNPRLLLASADRHPRGMGNEHDLVGRFFQDHLGIRSGLLVPHDPATLEGIGFYLRHSGAEGSDAPWMGMLAPTPEAVRRHGLLNSSWYVIPQTRPLVSDVAHSLAALQRARTFKPRPPHLGRHVAKVLTDPRQAIAVLRRRREKSGSREAEILQLKVMAEQAPNPDSRVTLAPDRDALGVPRARLDWRLSEQDTDSIRRTQELLDIEMRRAGIGRVLGRLDDASIPEVLHGNEHQLGTTRMHNAPRRGVVDADGRVHSMRNLFVAGGSVFPSSGYANPTLTVVALAIRLTTHIQAHLH